MSIFGHQRINIIHLWVKPIDVPMMTNLSGVALPALQEEGVVVVVYKTIRLLSALLMYMVIPLPPRRRPPTGT